MAIIYEKNLNALLEANPLLYARLIHFKSNENFEIFQGKDPLQLNFYDQKHHVPLYDKPFDDTLAKIESYKKYERYPFLYFFGLGNGVFLKTILDNPSRKTVTVIEPELEIIFIVLNLLDLSEEFLDNKLVIHFYEDVDFPLVTAMFKEFDTKIYAKLYFLDIMTPYYERFSTEITHISALIVDALQHVITAHGNDTIDTLIGIEHHIQNLPIMLSNPPFKSLTSKRNTDTAIIVSTGPSLAKQLPLLKEVAPHATLICIDASLPILEKWDIKPDIVVSLERVEATSKFYKNTSAEFQKDIIFVLASLVHEELLGAIKNGTKVLAMRPFPYTTFFEFHEYGYAGIGMSAANMAHDLAALMNFSRCILIGQDLAFGEDGKSHSQGHIFGEQEIKNKENDLYVEKYGGGGQIRTTLVWKMFLGYFEQDIAASSDKMETIDATEGGARIRGATERPFKELCAELLTQPRKERIVLTPPTAQEFEKNVNAAKAKISLILSYALKTQKKIEKTFLKVAEIFDELHSLNQKGELDRIDYNKLTKLNTQIDKIKDLFSDPIFTALFSDVIQSRVLHDEMDLAVLAVQPIDTDEEKKVKLVDWIMQHRLWLFNLAGEINAEREIIKRAMKKWK